MGAHARYRHVRDLGSGAGGAVSLVEDRLQGGRRMALKRLQADVDEVTRRALEHEFTTLSALSLPGVAEVFDFGLVDDGHGAGRQPFFTRAYVEGEALDTAADGHPSLARVQLFVRAAQRVAALHSAGVVHGDVKPANIIVDAREQAHLIDFGLAHGMAAARGRGAVGGTPAFMAPELFRGAAPTVSSDVFALGVTLWLMLTGTTPRPPSTSGGVRAGRGTDPPFASNLDGIAREALIVARRAVSAEPTERYPTVGELLAALRSALPDVATSTVSDGWVAPRARGHEMFAGKLTTRVSAMSATGGALVLLGDAGAGKSTLLRAEKWRCQLRGWPVLELSAAHGRGAEGAEMLIEQARLLAGNAGQADGHPSATQSTMAVADRCAAHLARLSTGHPVAVIVDDLDASELAIVEALRGLVHNEDGVAVVVLAAATAVDARTVVELGASEYIRIPPLDEGSQRALSTEALGAVDDTVLQALCEVSQGAPGRLLAALRGLAVIDAPTAMDVRRLDLGTDGVFGRRTRVGALSPHEQRLLALCSVIEMSVSPVQLASLTGMAEGQVAQAVSDLLDAGLLRQDDGGVSMADTRMGTAAQQVLGASHVAMLAAEALERADPATAAVARARLALAAGDVDAANAAMVDALTTLRSRRLLLAAAELCSTWAALLDGAARLAALIILAEVQHDNGDLQAAAMTAREILSDDAVTASQRSVASVWLARGLSARGEFDAALEAINSMPEHVPVGLRARTLRERAKIHLLRGSYEEVERAAEEGLSVADTQDLVRVELLTSCGMAASYRGDQQRARGCYQQALDLAHRHGSKRDEANVRAYLAIASMRSGDMRDARDQFAESLGIARALGDVGAMATFSLNVGAMDFYLGNVAHAQEHYSAAMRLAHRAGRANTALQARNNLAHVHTYFGLYEQAKAEVTAVLTDAQNSGLRLIEAQAMVLQGDLCARSGDVDGALQHYDQAARVYASLGQNREVADVQLDAAEAILDRGGPADVSAAAARLANAREIMQPDGWPDHHLRWTLLRCRAHVESGDAERSVEQLSAVITQARERDAKDVLWMAYTALGRAHDQLGTTFGARRAEQQAAEVLEEIALTVPREHREAFWQDRRRRLVKQRAMAAGLGSAHGAAAPDLRRDRLLEIIKHLAAEHDIERLLERITESAVELSGAERGYVLLVGDDGKLAMRIERSADATCVDPHLAFSRSVAEAVLIDGEPIVTVDAGNDQRVNEFLSVHQLMLRSLACLPITGRRGTVGVLYLEHRHHRGCFSGADVDVLHALADQAAVALENARLLAEEARRRMELEQANAELMQAKAEIESLLYARTEELTSARRELESAAGMRPSTPNQHGMIGRSAAMRRVFSTLDRLTANDVPVAVVGESGTGKELVARAIHRGGTRSRGPFVVVSCASIPEALVESELFGHVRGAFTGAERDRPGLFVRASGGTLFLDEVAEMPAKMQVDLLRVLQERSVRPLGSEHDVPVDLRVVAASSCPLEELVAERRLREDLYYRLNVVQIWLPPLRERREDISFLAEHMLRTFAKRDSKPPKRLSPEALQRLCAAPWPGNVRQLEHALLHAWVMVDGNVIRAEHLPLDGSDHVGKPDKSFVGEPDSSTAPAASSLEEHRELERRQILAALEKHAWNRVQAASALGMPRRTFYRRLRDYSIL